MIDKHAEAQRMVDGGVSNKELQAHLRGKYGSGISTTLLAEWRNDTVERDKRISRRAKASEVMGKRALIKQMISDGSSGYAAQQECKKQFGSSVGYNVIQAIHLELGQPASPAEPGIVPIDLPPEMMEDEPALDPVQPEGPATNLTLVQPEGPNGALGSFKDIQRWMADHDAESLSITRGGKLSVLARHEFDLGDLE